MKCKCDNLENGDIIEVDKQGKCLGCGRSMADMNQELTQRTKRQNRALHKYFQLLALELNDAGLDMKQVLHVDIPWSKDTVKEWIWKPVQHAQLLRKSTTELTTSEVGKVYETVNRLLGDKFGVHVPFPSDEESMLQNLES